MGTFLAKKDRGFFCTAAAVLCTLLGLVFFLLLASASPEESENPTLIIALSFAALLLHLVTAFKDYFKLPSLAAYAASTALLLLFLAGRASYLAFYFSGDVLNTGLSPFMVLAALCFLAGMAAALLAVVFRQEKAGIPGFRTGDLKALLPMAAVAVVLCAGTIALQGGSSAPAGPSGPDVPPSQGSDPVIDQPGAAYKTPTTDETVWQGYDAAAYLAENVSDKAIAYQLTGHGVINAGQDTDFDALLNLYEDGLSVLTVYGMGRVSTYYGYWTNVNDENLWFCVAYYTMEGTVGVCTIDYAYDLTDRFDEITVNVALGFADGGQFIRELPIGGDGSVVYPSTGDFLREKGKPNYTAPTTDETVWQSYDAAAYLAEDVSGKAIAYQLTGHGVINAGQDMDFDALLNLYGDGLSVLTVYGMGRASTYYGYWTNVDDENLWFCVAYYVMEGTEGICTIDYAYDLTGQFDEITVNIALGFADGGQFIRELPIGGSGAILYSSAKDFLTEKGWTAPAGSDPEPEEPDEPDEPEPVEAEILFRWTSDSENYLLDCNKDGTYTFTFVTAGLVETGSWTWKDWTFTLTDVNGKATTAEMDENSHTLSLHFEAAATAMVNRDFACDAATWGAALGTTGNYTAPDSGEPEVLFRWTSDSENFLLDCNKDGTYTFTFVTAGLVETGEWSWTSWTFTLTDANGKVTTATMDQTSHELSLHFEAAATSAVNRDFVCDAVTWGTALGTTGNYTAE